MIAGSDAERDDRAAEEARRLGVREVRVRRDRVAPGVRGHAEVIEHRLRAQEPGRERERGDAVRAQVRGLAEREPDRGRLDEVVGERAAVAVVDRRP